jgi:predicted GNAT family N-acyltransferase
MAEFQKIIDYHPEELSAHLGRVRVASRGFDDGKLARKLLRRSLRKLRDAESQRALRMEWERLMKEKVKSS